MLLEPTPDIMRPDQPERRHLLASHEAHGVRLSPFGLIALLYGLGLFLFYYQGLIRSTSFLGALSAGICLAALFFSVFRSGFNRRFREPTLTLAQLFATLGMMFAVAYLERATQIALVPFLLIAFSLCIFRMSTPSLLWLCGGCLGIYLFLIIMRGHDEGYASAFRIDLIQWSILALTLPGTIFAGKQIQHLRQQLHATQYELEHYEEEAVRDELTGLYNRRHLQATLEQTRSSAEAKGTTFSVCLIDIDHFKQINDSNGHLAGDKVLSQFAHVARECIRDSDVFGRYGGDEFLQILPHTDLKGAVMHAERLRVYAHFLDFEKILVQKHISLSIGVAQYQAGESITDLIARADSALYLAKQLGRNRVEWCEE